MAKWKRLNAAGNAVPTTAADSLVECNIAFYPNIAVLLRLLCTLPITTAECERTISRLRTLKTYLRSTMREERLNGLALMRMHRDANINIAAVVDAFAIKFETKMALRTDKLLNME